MYDNNSFGFFRRSWPWYETEGPARNEVTSTDQGFKITLEVPGYRAEDLHLSLDQKILRISGDLASRQVRRTFELSKDIEVEKISATCQHGVLTVTLPKKERASPRRIPVLGEPS